MAGPSLTLLEKVLEGLTVLAAAGRRCMWMGRCWWAGGGGVGGKTRTIYAADCVPGGVAGYRLWNILAIMLYE